MEQVLETDDDGKQAYLKQLMLGFVPGRVAEFVRSPSAAAVVQLVMIFVLTGTVGLGYLYGKTRPDETFLENREAAPDR
jgi:hypothetical protein